MQTTTYTIRRDPETRRYYVTDGIWESAQYTKTYAHKVLRDACWGSKGVDGRGTYTEYRTR